MSRTVGYGFDIYERTPPLAEENYFRLMVSSSGWRELGDN